MKGLTTLSFFALLYILIIIIFNEVAGDPRGVQNEDKVGQITKGSSITGVELEDEDDVDVDDDDDDRSLNQGGSPVSGTKTQNQAAAIPSADKAKFVDVAKTQEHLSSSQKDGNKEAKKQSQPELRQSGDPSAGNDTNPLADLFQITDPNMRQAMGAIYGAYKGNDQCSRKAFCMMGNYMKDMPGRDIIFLIMGNYIPKEFSLYYEIFKVAVLYGQNCNVYVCIPGPDPNDAASAARPDPGVILNSQSPSSSNQNQNLNAIPR